MCQGYYNHEKPYQPQWEGMDRFRGRIVHPQQWPDDLDHTGKRVVVIGSGATAATLVPAMAKTAAHVTMLQRSPSYFLAAPTTHELAVTLQQLDIPQEWTHEILRRQYIAQYHWLAMTSLTAPDELHAFLMEAHPARCCPRASTSRSTSPRATARGSSASRSSPTATSSPPSGRARPRSSPTRSRSSPRTGIRLSSGEELEADVVVTATGFNLSVFGDIPFTVDGEAVDFAERVTWRGLMISGVPNMAYVFGYFRHSWTLRVDLVSDLVLPAAGDTWRSRTRRWSSPTLRAEDADMEIRPWSDPENFNAGYVMRSQHVLFKQGDREPWKHMQEHDEEQELLPKADLDDGSLVYR